MSKNKRRGAPYELMSETQFEAFMTRRKVTPPMRAALHDHYCKGLSKSQACRNHSVSRQGFHLAASARGEAALKGVHILVPEDHAADMLHKVNWLLEQYAIADMAKVAAVVQQNQQSGVVVPAPDVLKGSAVVSDA